MGGLEVGALRDAISVAVTLAAMYAIGRGHQTEIQRRKDKSRG